MAGFLTLGRSGVEEWKSLIMGKPLHIIDTLVLHSKGMEGGAVTDCSQARRTCS